MSMVQLQHPLFKYSKIVDGSTAKTFTLGANKNYFCQSSWISGGRRLFHRTNDACGPLFIFFKIYEVKRFTWNGDGSNSETMRSFVSLAIFLRKTCELMDTAGLWSCMHLSVNGRTESETNQICIYCCCRWISAFVSSIANSTRKSSFSEGGLAQSEVEWLFWAHLAQLLLDAQLRSLVYRT